MTFKCLICGKDTNTNLEYHPSCSKKFFNSETPPSLDYELSEINEIAKETILESITLTGVQPKLSLHISKGNKNKKLTIVGLWGAYILKTQSPDYPFLPENEHLTMQLAETTGIKTVPHGLIRFKSGELAYITKRIDRNKNRKIHMEDMCQLQERITEDKYRGSVEQIGKTIKKYSSNPGYDLQNLFSIVLFSFITGNTDMHLKNYSLLYRKPDFLELAPAYDLLNTAIMLPSDQEESALTINGKKNRLKKDDFETLAENLELIPKIRDRIFRKTIKSMIENMKIIENSFLNRDMKTKYIETVNSGIEKLSGN